LISPPSSASFLALSALRASDSSFSYAFTASSSMLAAAGLILFFFVPFLGPELLEAAAEDAASLIIYSFSAVFCFPLNSGFAE